MPEYNWKNDTTKLLRILRASKKVKEKNKWSKKVGAGFIFDDIENVQLHGDKSFTLSFAGVTQVLRANELNLRETNELILFLERRVLNSTMKEKFGTWRYGKRC